MFPDKKMLDLMELGKAKLMYISKYGRALNFKNLLKDEKCFHLGVVHLLMKASIK